MQIKLRTGNDKTNYYPNFLCFMSKNFGKWNDISEVYVVNKLSY